LKIHIISASSEYKSEPSLKEFKDYLEKNHRVTCTASWGKDSGNSLDNLDPLAKADLLIVFARRLKLPEEQMRIIRSHWEQGKPVVGIRTAGHAFQQADNEVFDKQVLGGHYKGHYGNEPVKVTNVESARDHPVLKGIEPFTSRRLYSAGALAKDTAVLQMGDIGKAQHPVTIVHSYKGGRTFFTSLGVPEDFQDGNFRQMLVNAIFWTAQRDASAAGLPKGVNR
jgi:type 1 glutamine amidotransferase